MRRKSLTLDKPPAVEPLPAERRSSFTGAVLQQPAGSERHERRASIVHR
jgi:hypothetical protein